jgi:DUF1680 family protein
MKKTNSVNIITGAAEATPSDLASNGTINEGNTVRLIPYYLWSNRGVGKMKVWFPRTTEQAAMH